MSEITARPKPLFVIGNKRSGSTLTTDLLNAHPNVFVSHESDIAWILYQAKDGKPENYKAHPLDSPLMMSSTLEIGGQILHSTLGEKPTRDEIVEAFYQIQMRLLKQYLNPPFKQRLKRFVKVVGKKPTLEKVRHALRQKPEFLHKENLAWIGDKKHAQYLDPKVRAFLQLNFPDARYIHVVRHPRSVVASTMEAAKRWREMPDYFKSSAGRILEQWAIHEEWALQAKERENSRILTVRLEDLWADVNASVAKILNFLELEMTDTLTELAPRMIYPRDPNEKYASFALPDVPKARRIMEIYGY